MMMKPCFAIWVILVLLLGPAVARAGLKTEALKESVDYVMKTFGKEATEELGKDAAKVLARRIEATAMKYGEEQTLEAVKKVGPRMFRVIEEVGEEGAPKAIQLISRVGKDAIWIVTKKNRMAIFLKYGDDAAEAMMKHKAIAETAIEQFGSPASRALTAINGQNARRLSMLMEDGSLPKIGRTEELLGVVSRYGDAAMDFIWRNKGALAVGTTLTAFLANPQPFIAGAQNVSTQAIKSTEGVAAQATVHVVEPMVPWVGRAFLLVAVVVSVLLLIKYLPWALRRNSKAIVANADATKKPVGGPPT